MAALCTPPAQDRTAPFVRVTAVRLSLRYVRLRHAPVGCPQGERLPVTISDRTRHAEHNRFVPIGDRLAGRRLGVSVVPNGKISR